MIKENQFVHLHVHTQYSLLDGAARIDNLVEQAAENGQPALAITDHGCMYGVVDFYKACKNKGIKPIIGMETYVAPRSMTDKEGKMDREYAHLVLLAKNQVGYQNLCELSTRAFTQGYYYRPRIDYTLLEEKKEGLIVLSACLAGDLPRLLLDDRYEEAKEYVLRMQEIFGEDFYIELQDHGILEEKKILPGLMRLARECGVKPVCTNDVHYVKRDDMEAQDALLCIQTQRFVDDEDRMRMNGDQFYLKSTQEMAALFPSCLESLTNTLEVAEKCNLKFEFGKLHLPNYDVPSGYTHHAYLRKLCEQGLIEKCAGKGEEYRQRLNRELAVIEQMGYTDYFLIVWDFIDFARRNQIMVGPGRGSAAGSLAAFCLNITDVDPIRYGLIFERFLNPERISMPDIDIDFCYERRQEVIDYVVQKYGEDHVAQIITFGSMGAKQAIRDVGRVLQVPYGEVDRLAKMIPLELNITLERALKVSPELREACENDEQAKKIYQLAVKIEGLPRHASTHAAGVVISAKPIVEYLPLQTNENVITTQFPMGTIEELGLLKMDFLGLRTLTVMRDALRAIKSLGETAPDLKQIPYDDQNVYNMLSSGDTDGVFQLESRGMRSFLQQLKPDNFEEIIAGISLYRPGPMDQIPAFVERKFNPEKITYAHPLLEPILSTTHGCIVYQEQVMQIVRDLAGYSMGRSDLVRRAMSKKKKDVMEKESQSFIKGCAQNGVSEQIAKEIFAQMMDFAQYAFNKSHAAAYAVIAYQTAWLKYYYPEEFMAALLNSFIHDNKRIPVYIHSCRQQGIELLPPDVNHSLAGFSVELHEGKKAVRFGLGGIKHVGFGACDTIAQERRQNGEYRDLQDFLSRNIGHLNKRMVEAMIKAGAMDGFGKKRSVLYKVHAEAMDNIAGEEKFRRDGQVSFFDALVDDSMSLQIHYPEMAEYPLKQKLMFEKEAAGFYISGHPLREFQKELNGLQTTQDVLNAGEEGEMRDEERVIVGGIVSSVRRKLTRKNDQMAYVTIEDELGQFECVVFPRVLEQHRQLLVPDQLVAVSGRINTREDDENVLITDTVHLLEKGMDLVFMKNSSGKKGISNKQRLVADQGSQGISNGKLKREKRVVKPGLYLRCDNILHEIAIPILMKHPGSTPIIFVWNDKPYRDQQVLSCDATGKVVALLRKAIGKENVRLIY